MSTLLSGPTYCARAENGAAAVRLQTSEVFRDYQQAFHVLTNLPLALRPAGASRETGDRSTTGNPFCLLADTKTKTCPDCLRLQQRADVGAIVEPTIFKCFGGLVGLVVPVRLGETVIAYLQTGWMQRRAPTEKQFLGALKQLVDGDSSADREVLRGTVLKARVVPSRECRALLHLLGNCAHHLSLIAGHPTMRKAGPELPAVAKARAFIAEHMGEALSLRRVARAANMSAFYFCKVFKTGTGFTLTDYLSRARVSRTKHLLLNPHVRISEAAYEAGFQSLSQFNRVFRRITGESPTFYRAQIGGAPGAVNVNSSLAFAA